MGWGLQAPRELAPHPIPPSQLALPPELLQQRFRYECQRRVLGVGDAVGHEALQLVLLGAVGIDGAVTRHHLCAAANTTSHVVGNAVATTTVNAMALTLHCYDD